MNRVAFVCPLFDMKNHFELALNLYRSRLKYHVKEELYFIFSNIGQKDKFECLLHSVYPNEELKYLITTDEINSYKAKAVSKKFFALEKLMGLYDYIIVTDCEACYIRECDYGKLSEEIWNSRSMLNANKSPDGYFIMRRCFKTLGVYKNRKLRKDTKNYYYNFWFNDLQVYKCSLLPDFFAWLDNHNKKAVYDEYMCFEYYVFYAYLLLEHDIHLNKFNYKSMGGINEYLYRLPVDKQLRVLNDMNLHWSSSKQAISDKTVMLFHLDRSMDDSAYSKESFWNEIKLGVQRMKCEMEDLVYHE